MATSTGSKAPRRPSKKAGVATLSADSLYEQRFGTRYRGRGRPAGSGAGSDVFAGTDAHPLLVRAARQRTLAVVFDEQRKRMGEVFRAELAVLRKRGLKVVARDEGVELSEEPSSETK